MCELRSKETWGGSQKSWGKRNCNQYVLYGKKSHLNKIKIEINNLYIKDIFVHNYFYNCFLVPLPKSDNALTLLTWDPLLMCFTQQAESLHFSLALIWSAIFTLKLFLCSCVVYRVRTLNFSWHRTFLSFDTVL